jgi:glycosyltransferase involved in cell wall biosynthesis
MTVPLVSVVIPMRNEAQSIGACLEGVLAQDYPRERLEVLVADGRSDDDSAAVVQRVAASDPRVRLLDNPGRVVPTGLNLAIRAARGDIIARVDGHTRIAADYIRAGVEALRRTGADNVGGPMHAVGGGLFGDAVARAMSSRLGVGAYFHYGSVEREVDTVYLGMWPRAVFERVGLFDEELVRNQDDEFNYRLRKAGGRAVLVPAMRSWYQNRQSPRALARQFFQYGAWKVRVLQKHPRQMSWRHFVPPTFVGGVVIAGTAAVVVPLAALLAGIATAAYGLTIGAAAGVLAWRGGWRAWAATAAAFAIIHLAWGAGFLSGLVRFAHRWRGAEPPVPLLPAPAPRG